MKISTWVLNKVTHASLSGNSVSWDVDNRIHKRAPGDYGIVIEAIKLGEDLLIERVRKLFKQCIHKQDNTPSPPPAEVTP